MCVCVDIKDLLHFFPRIPEVELEKSLKMYSGLKMKLNNFRRQLDSMKGLNAIEDEWMPIRSEWTTVEKVLDSRYHS